MTNLPPLLFAQSLAFCRYSYTAPSLYGPKTSYWCILLSHTFASYFHRASDRAPKGVIKCTQQYNRFDRTISITLPNLRRQQEPKHRSQRSRVHQAKNGHLSKRNNGPPHLHLSHEQPNNILWTRYPTATQTHPIPTLFFSRNLDSKLYSLRQ